MDHHRPLRLTGLVDILQLKALRLDEVQLSSRQLMFPPQGIGRHEINLRAVEGRLAILLVIFDITQAQDSLLELFLC